MARKPKTIHKAITREEAFEVARMEARIRGKSLLVLAPNRIDCYRVHPDGTEEECTNVQS